jgi:hypothetical protein
VPTARSQRSRPDRKLLKMVTPGACSSTTASDLLANRWQLAVLLPPGMRQAGCWTRPELLVLGGAPRRNRTGDPILTMEPPGTAVRTAVLAGNARPSGSKLSVLLRPSYAFTSRQTLRCRGQAIVPVEVTTSVSASVWERGVAAAIRQGSEPGGDPPKPPGTASPGTSTARGVRNPRREHMGKPERPSPVSPSGRYSQAAALS